MKKEDMSSAQIQQRTTFIESLRLGGWEIDDNWSELFEGGADLEPESQAQYAAQYFQVRIGIHAQGGFVMLECESRDGAGGSGLYLFFGDRLRPVLSEISSRVSSLSRDNYLEMVRALTLICDEVLLQSGGELVKVSSTEPANGA